MLPQQRIKEEVVMSKQVTSNSSPLHVDLQQGVVWFVLAMALCCFSLPALAKEKAVVLPDSLMYRGKTIEPICMNPLVESTEAAHVDLSKCTTKGIVIEEESREPQGYNYQTKEEGAGQPSMMGSPYISYHYLGMVHNAPLVQIQTSGGGTGRFTNLFLLKREGDVLRVVKSYGGGDRCNGGILSAAIEDGHVVVTSSVTPGDFLNFSGANPHGLKPYADLDASATSCIGEVRFEDEKLTGFTPLSREDRVSSDQEWVKRYKHQACFNRLLVGVHSEAEWTPAQIKEFMRHFNRSCVEGK